MPTTPPAAPRPASRRVRSRETTAFMPLDCIDPRGPAVQEHQCVLECVQALSGHFCPTRLSVTTCRTLRRTINYVVATTTHTGLHGCHNDVVAGTPAVLAAAAADDRGEAVERPAGRMGPARTPMPAFSP